MQPIPEEFADLSLRQAQILELIVRIYTEEACPVSSKKLAEIDEISWSSATIRHELLELEELEYLVKPHTSAGRIPSEKAYRFFIKCCVQNVQIIEDERKAFQGVANKTKSDDRALQFIKAIADFSDSVAVLNMENRSYSTGLGNLLSQPEFNNQEEVVRITKLVDELDGIMDSVRESMSDSIEIKIGDENPFGNHCGVVFVKAGDRIFGVLGPLRMSYEDNVARLNFIRGLLN